MKKRFNMKKIFIVAFNFFLFSYEYSFGSSFIWKVFEKRKNQPDRREDSYSVRLNYGKSFLDQQKWKQTTNRTVYKTMDLEEFVAEKTYSFMSFFLGGTPKLLNKFVSKKVQEALNERPHEKYNQEVRDKRNFGQYYTLVQKINNNFPFLPIFLLSSYFNKPDPYSTFGIHISPMDTIQSIMKIVENMQMRYDIFYKSMAAPINYKKYQIVDNSLKKALIIFDEIIKKPSKINLSVKFEELVSVINTEFDVNYDLTTYFTNKVCCALIFAMSSMVFSNDSTNRADFSLYEKAFMKENDGKSSIKLCMQEVWQKIPTEKKFQLMLSAGGVLCLTGLLLRLSYVTSRFMMRKVLETKSGIRVKNFIKKQVQDKIQSTKDALTLKNKLGSAVLYFLFCNFFNFSNPENSFLNIVTSKKIDEKYVEIVKEDYLLNDTLLQFAKVENINPIKIEKLVKLITILEYYIKNPSELNQLKLVKILKHILGKTMGINSDKVRKQIEEKMELVRLNLLPENKEMVDAIKENIKDMSDEEIVMTVGFVNILNLVVWNTPELVQLISNGVIYEDSQKTLQELGQLSHANLQAEIEAFKRNNKQELDKILKVDVPVDTQREDVNTNTEKKSSN